MYKKNIAHARPVENISLGKVIIENYDRQSFVS